MHLIYRIKQLILILGDLGSFFVGLWIALLVRNLPHSPGLSYTDHASVFVFLFFIWIVINFINELFDLGKVRHTFSFYKRILETAVISFIAGIVFFYIIQIRILTPKTVLFLTALFGYSLSLLWRIIYIYTFKKHNIEIPVLFLGFTKEVAELVTLMEKESEKGYKCALIIDPDKQVSDTNSFNTPVLIEHIIQNTEAAVKKHHIKLIVIAAHLTKNERMLKEMYNLLFTSTQIVDLSSFYQTIAGRVPISSFSEGWFLDHIKNQSKPLYNFVQRAVDYIGGIVLLCIFGLVFPFVAVAIKLNSKGHIFYIQSRIGKNNTQFNLIKFRSMYSLSTDGGAETTGVQFATKGDKRITAVGNILRKTRIDELPQAINLLKGEVTLIGPRPERPEIVKQLENRMPYYGLRHIIKPGLTGWAQVHQHYTDNLETSLEKIQYDLFYIKNRSILIDLSILLRTINVVLRMMGQ